MNAVMGKILWVDLTHATWHEEQVPEHVYQHFLSGLGLAAYYLYQRIPAHADPLGEENVLAFVSGLLTGTGSMVTGRWMVAAKSPLTGTWGDANCGGNFSPAIKQCGYDGIFFSGISPKPVFLRITPNKIELRDATYLWGKDTRETEDWLNAAFVGKKPCVAAIGPAGENLSLISGISNDHGRMAARSGLGAVMGSKRLKAVVLQGSKTIRAVHPEKMRKLTEKFVKAATFQPRFLDGKGTRWLGVLTRILPVNLRMDGILYKIFLSKYGTMGLNLYSIESGDAPIKNWGGSNVDMHSELSESVNPDHIKRKEYVKYHCYSCPIGCGGRTRFNGGSGETHKPEYESIMALGALLMNQDLESLFEANEMLNRAGMDTISAGGTAAFAIECFEKGILSLEDTGGLQLSWGNSKAILKLLEMMIKREGIGDLLADGSKIAAQKIGKGSERFAVHAGGQELAMHDGRNDPGYALHYAVEPAPGRHTIGSYQYYEMFQLWRRVHSLPAVKSPLNAKRKKYLADNIKAAWAVGCSQFMALLNGAGGCLFAAMMGVHRYPIFEWLNAATGWHKTPEEYLQIGWNIQSVRQAFNAREGIILSHAINNRAIGQPPQLEGANKGRTVPLSELIALYWKQMGWNEQTGAPPGTALTALGLPPYTQER